MRDRSTPHAKIVILGGAGFIGRHLAEYFAAESSTEEIVVADLRRPAVALPSVARFIEADVRQPLDVGSESADLVVNLAAVHRTPGHPDHEYFETNEAGARNAVALAAELGAGSIWFTSSIAVYGPSESPKTERSAPAPVSAYGKSKLSAEAIHSDWARERPGRALTIARPATVFGTGEGGNFTRLAGALRRRTFAYPGRRDTLKACGYVGDLGPAFAAMEVLADPISLFNFAYPKPPTIEEICLAMADVGDLPKPLLEIPAPVLTGVGRVLHAAGLESFDAARIKKLTQSTNIEGEALVEHGYRFKYPLRDALADWRRRSPSGRFE